MIWVDCLDELVIPAPVELALLRAALAARPDSAARHCALGAALVRAGELAQAKEALETGLRRDPGGFDQWAGLARCRLENGDAEGALAACARAGGAAQGEADLHVQRGRALRALGREDEAAAAFGRALKLGDPEYDALRALLAPLARAADGGALLGFCDSLDPIHRETPLVRAHRAIALSRLGREAEALALVDPQAHVHRVRFEPPAEYGGIDAFNAMLEREILADPARLARPARAFDIVYDPAIADRPAFAALLSFIRAEIALYAASLPARGLSMLLPLPETAALAASTLVLTGDGSNGEHVHRFGHIATVYHVRVPASVSAAADDRGALVLGACDTYTGGYQPCWGKRFVRPEPGWLTLFPAHLHHDVVPSRTKERRISVSADLRAADARRGARRRPGRAPRPAPRPTVAA